MMNCGVERIPFFRRLVNEARKDAESVAEPLLEAVRGLTRGIPIGNELLTTQVALSERMEKLHSDLQAYAVECGGMPPKDGWENAGFEGMNSVIKEIEAKAHNILESAISTLELVQRLEVVKESRRRDFEFIFDEARRLLKLAVQCDESSAIPQGVLDIASGEHFLTKLIQFLKLKENPTMARIEEMDVAERNLDGAFDRRFRLAATRDLRLPTAADDDAEHGLIKARTSAPFKPLLPSASAISRRSGVHGREDPVPEAVKISAQGNQPR